MMSDDPKAYFAAETRACQTRAAWVHRDMVVAMSKLTSSIQPRGYRHRMLVSFKQAIEHQRYSAAASRRARKLLFTLLGVPENE